MAAPMTSKRRSSDNSPSETNQINVYAGKMVSNKGRESCTTKGWGGSMENPA